MLELFIVGRLHYYLSVNTQCRERGKTLIWTVHYIFTCHICTAGI